MKPTIKITFQVEDITDKIFYISYEELIEMIEKKTKFENMNIIDVEVYG